MSGFHTPSYWLSLAPILLVFALFGCEGAAAQDYVELVKIDVIVPDRPEANTTLLPGQDNVWDLRISEPYRVFVTYRVRMGTDTIGSVELVQRRTDTGEEKINSVTAPTDGSRPPGHVLNRENPSVITTATGPGGNGAAFSVAFREGDEFRGLAPPLEYQLFLVTNVVADKHLNPLAQSQILTVRPPAGDVDYEISDIEVVQTVQDTAGSVPLVANKPTVARVYIQAVEGSTPRNDRVSARLSGRQVGGERLGTISPRFRHRFVRPTGAANPPDRNKATSSLVFVFPDSWTQAGRLALEAEIDIETTPLSDDLSNNITRTGALFTERQAINVGYLPICLKQDGGTETLCPDPSDLTVQELLAEEIFPLPENGLRYFEATPLFLDDEFKQPFDDGGVDIINRRGKRVARLDGALISRLIAFALHRARLVASSTAGADIDAFAIMVPDGTVYHDFEDEWLLNFALPGQRPKTVIAVADPTAQGEVGFARGLAWLFGADLAHPGCVNLLPTPWPTPKGTIAATDKPSDHDAVGFDVLALGVKPSTLKDVTTGCDFDDVWISGLNSTKLFRTFLGPAAGLQSEDTALEPEAATLQSTGEILLMTAEFRTDGSAAAIESLSRIESATELSPSASGEYCVEVHDANGLFARECFGVPDLPFADLPPPDDFVVSSALPFPADAVSIRLLYQGNELLARTPSPNPPTVNITAPAASDRWEGGPQVVAWTAADADDDPLRFDLFASFNGGADWQFVSAGLETEEVRFNADRLDAGELSLRVVANDGFHASDAVVGPITVATTPEIEAPADLDLGFAVVEDVAMGELRIRNSGQGRLQIDEVVVDNPSFEVLRIPDPFQILAGTDAPLRIRYLPTAVGVETAVLTIRSNAGDQPELTINLRAEGVDAETPTIAVSRRMLDLGEVPLNQTATGTITVTNTSLAELTVEAVVSGAGFSLDSAGPFVLTPGEQQASVEVAFSSASEGAFAGTLIFTSNDPNLPRVEVMLSATAVDAADDPGAGGPQPSISADGVRNAATFQPGMVQGSWITIFGDNLAKSTRTWDGAISGTTLPTELDGVAVLIGGKPAAVFFISPGQLNVQVPDGLTLGPVDVQVILDGVASSVFSTELSEVAPGFFLFDPESRKYLAAVHLDGVFVGKEGLFGGAVPTRPVSPGERVLLFGTGFGLTEPATPTGVIPGVAALAAPVSITIGGVEATVEFAGIVGAGLYQFNVIIPDGLASGDAEVLAQIGGRSSPMGAFVTVGP